MTLARRAEATLRTGSTLMADRPEFDDLRARFAQAERQFAEPMTVAIIGRIKAGKSTLTNALLGEELAPVARIECTFNVSVFRYGATRSMVIHYKDGRPPQRRDPHEFEQLVVRDDGEREQLRGIDHIDYECPNALLQTFSLVDTPGLESAYFEDSKNTLDWLGHTAEELTRRTEQEAARAHAVLYLFSRGISEAGARTLSEFVGPAFAGASPLNAIGVLTRVDSYWKEEGVRDPFETGARICRRWAQESGVARLFYAVKPVSGRIALGLRALTAQDYTALAAFAELSDDQLRELVMYPVMFLRCDDGAAAVNVPAEARTSLLAKLDQYGIVEACRIIRAGARTLEELRPMLSASSGMPSLDELIRSHFGNRALQIKTERIITDLRLACFALERKVDAENRETLYHVAGALEALFVGEHDFAELAVLKSYYAGTLRLEPDEVDEVLRVTGERGTAVETRLAGELVAATPEELLDAARRRIEHWSIRAMSSDKVVRDAAVVLRRSYERLSWLLAQSTLPTCAERFTG